MLLFGLALNKNTHCFRPKRLDIWW